MDQGFLCARQAILTLSHPTLCLCLVDCGFVVFICWLVGLLLFVCFLEERWVLFCFDAMSPGITQAGLQLTVNPRMTS